MDKMILRFLMVALALCAFTLLVERRQLLSTPSETELVENETRAIGRPEPIGAPKKAIRVSAGDPFQDQVPIFAEEVEKILNSEDSSERDKALTQLLQQWVGRDPLAAANFAQGIEPPELREKIRHLVLQAWTALDPSAALSWAAELTLSFERQTTMGQILAQMLERDPQVAVQAAISHFDETKNGLLEQLMQQWAAQDFSSAHEWITQQAPSEQRDELLAHIAFTQSRTAPEEAARLVAEEISSGDTQVEAAIWVLSQWALSDPKGALAWLKQFPEGSIRDRAQREISRSINTEQ
jgi:hypothetical protein